MTAPNGLPPRSTLVYMFADQLIEPDDWKSSGTPVPGRQAKVKTGQLAAHIFAVAFLGLMEDGALSLRLEEKKRLGIRSTKVLAQPGTPPADRRTSIVEDGILQGLFGGSGEQEVNSLVWRAMGEDQSDPRAYVVEMAEYDGVQAGFWSQVDAGRGAIGRAFLGKHVRTPLLERFPEAEPAFQSTLQSWRSFGTANPQLATELLAKCEKGIKSRMEASDPD